jgi:hypothetical protein
MLAPRGGDPATRRPRHLHEKRSISGGYREVNHRGDVAAHCSATYPKTIVCEPQNLPSERVVVDVAEAGEAIGENSHPAPWVRCTRALGFTVEAAREDLVSVVAV